MGYAIRSIMLGFILCFFYANDFQFFQFLPVHRLIFFTNASGGIFIPLTCETIRIHRVHGNSFARIERGRGKAGGYSFLIPDAEFQKDAENSEDEIFQGF